MDRHFDTKQCKSGNKFLVKKYTNCPYCFIDLSGINIPNHIKWCNNNPDRGKGIIDNPDSGKQMQTPAARLKRAAGVKHAHAAGKYAESYQKKLGKPGTPHTDTTKQKLRENALASPHRRLVRSIREYIQKDGTIVKLDSSWEEALATRLDGINVGWIRPGPVKWVDKQNVKHNYFPDFYLPVYDLYLDPKNMYAIKAQQSKIDCLLEQLPNLIIIKSLEECNSFTPTQYKQQFESCQPH